MFKSIIAIFALSVVVLANVDTIPRKLFVGYDEGLSFRFFPKCTAFGYGLMIQATGYNLYGDSESDREYNNSNSSSNSHHESKYKGVQLLAETYYRSKIGRTFLITPFIALGGLYSLSNSTQSYSYYDGSRNISQQENHTSKQISRAFVGQIGVMPGLEFGRFQVEFRLGIKGSLEKTTSPEKQNNTENSHSKNIRLIYPSEIVRAIIIHIGL